MEGEEDPSLGEMVVMWIKEDRNATKDPHDPLIEVINAKLKTTTVTFNPHPVETD